MRAAVAAQRASARSSQSPGEPRRTEVVFAFKSQAGDHHVGTAAGLAGSWEGVIVQRVDLIVAPVAEVGEDAAQGNIGALSQVVIGAPGQAPAGAVINVIAKVLGGVVGGCAARVGECLR